MKNKYIIIDSKDNCATALEDIPQGTKINLTDKFLKIHHRIPLGHKFAINNIKNEDYIVKYGEIIGIATENIDEGDWIHIHNIKSTYLEVKKDG
ncbi:MAG: UxaA family hydrolase [Candidatus Lokiarchaeota archaeon]|nr:UxaA family hydrolase [Candidatus Lokiarchaeota archaeon]